VKVLHLIPGSPPISQSDLESGLVEKYYPNYRQAILLNLEERPLQELIDEAYKKRNSEIGYTKDGE
jgi:hypothetical protein